MRTLYIQFELKHYIKNQLTSVPYYTLFFTRLFSLKERFQANYKKQRGLHSSPNVKNEDATPLFFSTTIRGLSCIPIIQNNGTERSLQSVHIFY